MKQKRLKFHSLIMLCLGIYITGASGLMIFGLINQTSRPYVITFIAITLCFTFYAALTAPSQPSQ